MVSSVKIALVAMIAFSTPIASIAQNDDLGTIVWELVSTTDDLAQIEAFIDNFPDSENIEAAKALADRIRMRGNATELEETIFETVGSVSFNAPLAFGDEHIMGRTLSEITQSSPAYPPIEGLPDEVWKDKPCASCHQWTREDLCVQANTYVSIDPMKYREKMHPFGGLLKINLKNWAQNGCE